MNIVHITASFRPAIGGISNHVNNVCRTQIASGHNVTVVTATNGIYNNSEVIDKILVKRYPSHRSPIRVILWHLRNLPLYLKADVIHVHSLFSIESVPKVLINRSKTVITLHGWGGKYPIPKEQVCKVSSSVPKIASGVITVGSFVNKWFNVKSDEVIYGATSHVKKMVEKDYDICILGRLEEDAGINVYADSLRNLCELSSKRLKICICGDGNLRNKLIESISDKADVEFKGFIDDPQNYIQRSEHCFTSGYLGILEALTLGCKVYAVFENPVKRDYLLDSPYSDFIITASNADELTKCFIEKTQANKCLSEFNAMEFSWVSLCEAYKRVYMKIR